MGEIHEFNKKVQDEHDRISRELNARFKAEDNAFGDWRPLSRVTAEDVAEAELQWARVWRGVELQKAIESIIRTDGWIRFVPELIHSTWRAFRSKD